MRKTLYVLNVDAYAPALTALTYPLLRYYAHRIGAAFYVIDTRRFPAWPVVYEKCQIFELAAARGDDWSIYIDSDALVHPECVDFTEHLPKDTVAHHGVDMAAVRWEPDDYFRRDGRWIGSCNWLAIASAWCRDLWRPLDDLTPAEAIARIRPTLQERTFLEPSHLIDDYTCSRNIARFGLKYTTIIDLLPKIGLPDAHFFWHNYTDPIADKVTQMEDVLKQWQIPDWLRTYGDG